MGITKQIRFKHSPGEWNTTKTISGTPAIYSKKNNKTTHICNMVVLQRNVKYPISEMQVNVKLIIAAPDMVKELNAVRSAIFNHGQKIKELDPVEWFDRLTRVINKATDNL